MSLRGFADGQFNVTLDGIPFQDPDGFSHHSTSVFPAATIDHLVIDRSPGSATDLGYATIGGSIQIATVQIPAGAGVRVYGAYGTFATGQAGFRLNTARPTADGQTGVLVNVDHMQSDGAMSDANGRKDDLLLKTETRLGDSRLTALVSYDRCHFDNPPSVTTAQLAQFGSRFGFTDAPGVPSYYGCADTNRHTDFGYLRWQFGAVRGWRFTETVYTYSYANVDANVGLSLKGDASSATSSPVGSGFGVPATDIAGRLSNEAYRSWGNIVQAEHADGIGTFRGGLWIERSRQTYYRLAEDLTTGAEYNINKTANSPTLFDYTSTLHTEQPFAEYEWTTSHGLTLRGGLRYQRVRRGFDPSVVPNSLPGAGGEIGRSVGSTLPTIDARYAFDRQSQAYVQWSTGALVPNQSFFYTTSPAANNQAEPETSRALQAGYTRKAGAVDVTVDAYTIDLKNYFSSATVSGPSGSTTEYLNNGDVLYRGVEFEGSARLGGGFNALAQYSLIRAQYQNSGVTGPNSPQKAGARSRWRRRISGCWARSTV